MPRRHGQPRGRRAHPRRPPRVGRRHSEGSPAVLPLAAPPRTAAPAADGPQGQQVCPVRTIADAAGVHRRQRLCRLQPPEPGGDPPRPTPALAVLPPRHRRYDVQLEAGGLHQPFQSVRRRRLPPMLVRRHRRAGCSRPTRQRLLAQARGPPNLAKHRAASIFSPHPHRVSNQILSPVGPAVRQCT